MNSDNVEFSDNSDIIRSIFAGASVRAATAVGDWVVNAAKRLCAPKGPKGNPFHDYGALANSITSQVEETDDGPVLIVGSNMQVAPYIELGTAREYSPPPEWMAYNGEDEHTKAGLASWPYKDELTGELKIGMAIPPQPYLRPAFLDNVDDIKITIREYMENAEE